MLVALELANGTTKLSRTDSGRCLYDVDWLCVSYTLFEECGDHVCDLEYAGQREACMGQRMLGRERELEQTFMSSLSDSSLASCEWVWC